MVMLKRVLGIGLLAVILSFVAMPGFEVSAKGYKVPKPPETINMFGDILHPVYIGATSDHMYIYTTQESIDNLLAYKDYDRKNWDLYIIEVPGTEELHKDTVSGIIEDADECVTWLPAKSRTLWGMGSQIFVASGEFCFSYDMEYYNPDGEIIGFQREDGNGTDGDRASELSKLITDFINKQYDEHKMNTYSSYIH